ncbi:hypothetical protein Tco_1355970 [Tanacetum coccineum]
MQLQAEEFDLMAATGDIDEIEKVNANYILMANLQQASTSGIQIGQSPVYDSDGTYEVHVSLNYHDNDIFNMFTQEEQYTEVLEPISEPHHIQQNNRNVTSVDSSMEQSGGTVQQHFATIEETHAHYESLFTNLAVEVKKVNMVDHKLKEANAKLTIELARYKSQEKSFEINKAKFNKLETGYGKSVYREQCLNKKINALHLSSGVERTAKTRIPQPRSNTKNDRVPCASTSNCLKNKEVEVEEHHRNLLLSNNKKYMSSECNNVKLAIRNAKSEVVCAMCKQCLITANHDVIQICVWCVDSGCLNHMTGNLKLLINFVWKFLGTVRFGNDPVTTILGYGDLQ